MKIKILFGLPGSGKTTWAKGFCSQNKNWVRVNRDDLRNMRGDYWIPKQEDMITQWEDECVLIALRNGLNVILDSTNLDKDRNMKRVARFRAQLDGELKVEYKSFLDVDVSTCIKNDLKRPNSVGEKVIRKFLDKYFHKRPAPILKQNESLPRAYIFDVDGTLAKMDGRGPYDWDKVDTDKVNEPVAELLRSLERAYTIIIFTGRDGSCSEKTEAWLSENNIPYDEFYIRPEGNTEKDSIIKKRMFDEHVRDKYYVEAVIDDRDQVVDMWRNELGLTCLQVDYGDF